jgi:hypothetical protein
MLDTAISTAYRSTPWPEFYTKLEPATDVDSTAADNAAGLRQSLGLAADASDVQVEEAISANYKAFMLSLSL